MKGINYRLDEFLGHLNNNTGDSYANTIKMHKNEVKHSITIAIGFTNNVSNILLIFSFHFHFNRLHFVFFFRTLICISVWFILLRVIIIVSIRQPIGNRKFVVIFMANCCLWIQELLNGYRVYSVWMKELHILANGSTDFVASLQLVRDLKPSSKLRTNGKWFFFGYDSL